MSAQFQRRLRRLEGKHDGTLRPKPHLFVWAGGKSAAEVEQAIADLFAGLVLVAQLGWWPGARSAAPGLEAAGRSFNAFAAVTRSDHWGKLLPFSGADITAPDHRAAVRRHPEAARPNARGGRQGARALRAHGRELRPQPAEGAALARTRCEGALKRARQRTLIRPRRQDDARRRTK
jgi:hypothetical protein